MTECGRIKQGNTGPLWLVGIKERDANGVETGNLIDVSNVNWVCTVACNSAVPPISRVETNISADNTRFMVQLTPAETATLSAGSAHTIAIEVVNTTLSPAFEVESHVDLIVDAQQIM